ncbi:MAG: recombinase family protein [Candidatus Nanoarchaeia archaeon]
MRVSRADLELDNQRLVLMNWRNAHQTEIEKETWLSEKMTTRRTRPMKQEAMRLLRMRLFDTVVVTKIDRWARSTVELVQDVSWMIDNGFRFIAIENGFDFSKHLSASQVLQFQIFSAFAEFERDLIRERTLDGLARAKAQGKHLGRPRKIHITELKEALKKSPPEPPLWPSSIPKPKPEELENGRFSASAEAESQAHAEAQTSSQGDANGDMNENGEANSG